MKYCPTCNTEYDDKFRFCRLDGTALLVEKQVPEPVRAESRKAEGAAAEPGEKAQSIRTEELSESLREASLTPAQENPTAPTVEQTASDGEAAVPQGGAQEIAAGPTRDTEPRKVFQDLRSRPIRGDRFELLVQEEIKKAFPSAFVRSGVQVRSIRRTTEVDLFVLLPNGVFLIECKNYSGKIIGSLNYDQKQGEFWTCQTTTGETVQITSTGKNPADQALTRFHALHDMAKDAWGEANRPYIFPVLLFPDEADLSGITQMTVYPDRPSSADRVVATTLSKMLGYLASADSFVDQAGALKLIDFLGIPRSSLSGTWLDEAFKAEPLKPPKKGPEEYPDRPPPGEELSPLEGSRPQPTKDEHDHSETAIDRQRRSISGRMVAITGLVVGALCLGLVGKWIFYPGSTKLPELSSRQEVPRPQPSELATPLPPLSGSESSSIIPENSQDQEKVPPAPTYEKTLPGARIPPSRVQESPDDSRTPEPKLPGPILRRPAEPGIYETIRPTYVRTQPNDSAAVADQIGSGARLNVLGSEGSWLIVRSNKLQATVYIKRDDAMFLPGEKPSRESSQEAEARWRKVESEIHEAFIRWGVTGVSVSFIGDTAYLNGHVKTDYERFRAEQAARTIPEVQRIQNGVWVTP